MSEAERPPQRLPGVDAAAVDAGAATRGETTRALITSFGSSLAIVIVNLMSGVVLARAFDVDDRGELAAVLLWPTMITTLGEIGIPEAVTYETAQGRTDDRRILGTGLLLGVMRATVLTVITAALLPLLLGRYGSDAVTAGYVFLGFVWGHSISPTLIALLYGRGRYALVGWLRLLVISASAFPLVVLAAFDALTLMTAVLCYLGAQVVTLAWAGVAVMREVRAKPIVDRDVGRRLLSYGIRSHASTMSAQLNLRLDQLVISVALSARDFGLYVVGATLSLFVALIGLTIGQVALPLLGRLRDAAERAETARGLVRLALYTSVALAVPGAVFVEPIIEFAFGERYVDVAPVSRVLLLAAIAQSLARVLEGVLRAVGLPWDAGRAELTALGLTVVGLAVLLPTMGLMGAAVASLVAYATSAAWQLTRVRAALGGSIRSLLVGRPVNPFARRARDQAAN